jgi:hypothetical protein
MKTALAALILISGFAQAALAENGTLLICKEITATENTPKRTMVLRQVGEDAIVEGNAYKFEFRLFAQYADKPVFSGPVTVTTKDVMVSFASADDSVQGIVFKDELDQTAVRIAGEDIGFDCN